MAIVLPHKTITAIPDTEPPAVPDLWNTRYDEIDENFERLSTFSNFCECGTDASNSEKSATLENFSLSQFCKVLVRFNADNTAENVTLNVSNTGAKPVLQGGSPIKADNIKAGHVYEFMFDGTSWVVVGGSTVGTVSGSSLGLLNPDPAKLFDAIYGVTDGDIIGDIVIGQPPMDPSPSDIFEDALTDED